PAPSISAFTTLSGLGFGLLVFLGLGLPAPTGWAAFWHFGLAFALSVAGLLASLGHLGHPERAWKALSQWRSSWLSREGCLSIAALAAMGVFALGRVFELFDVPWLGWIGAVLSLATIFATSMIYAQLKTVPRWNHWSTPTQFGLYALAGGALLAALVTAALILIVAASIFQVVNWHWGDSRFAERGHSQETATGLGPMGQVKSFEPPHTGTNYLMNEMIHRVGRKHAVKLRRIGILLAATPLLLLVLPALPILIGVLAILHAAGVLVIRWLFFAEAEHVVGLYYGATQAA
ncbi:MAG: DmsC/YnfH family molybdoenzyme membrane anchor subunit, partial [Pseudomonadota bacterium]